MYRARSLSRGAADRGAVHDTLTRRAGSHGDLARMGPVRRRRGGPAVEAHRRGPRLAGWARAAPREDHGPGDGHDRRGAGGLAIRVALSPPRRARARGALSAPSSRRPAPAVIRSSQRTMTKPRGFGYIEIVIVLAGGAVARYLAVQYS